MDDGTTDRLGTILAALLGAAAIATAFTAYQGELKSGESIAAYNEGIRAVTEGGAALGVGFTKMVHDDQLFFEWRKADYNRQKEWARWIRVYMMDGNLRAGLREWERTGEEGPLTAIQSEDYKVEAIDQAAAREERADTLFAEAAKADDEGDRYVLITVFLAVALFFFGLAGVLRVRRTRLAVTVIGVGIFATSLAMLAAA